MINYFAYGSNMSSKRLFERIGNCNIIGIGSLENYTLNFNKISKDESGKSTIYFKNNEIVYGVIYQISEEQEKILDKFEGYKYGYNKIYVDTKHNNLFYNCLTYIADKSYIDNTIIPYDWYLALIIEGMVINNIDKNYIDKYSIIQTKIDKNLDRRYKHYKLLETLINEKLYFDTNLNMFIFS